jgi:hypothetical protein
VFVFPNSKLWSGCRLFFDIFFLQYRTTGRAKKKSLAGICTQNDQTFLWDGPSHAAATLPMLFDIQRSTNNLNPQYWKLQKPNFPLPGEKKYI